MKPVFSLLLLCILSSASALNASDVIKRYTFNPWEPEIGYVQAVVVGNTLAISGVTGAGDTLEAQLRSIFDRHREILKYFNLTFADVYKENAYTTDLDALKAAIPVRKMYYEGVFPAATWVQVERLFMPEMLLEVELFAYIPFGHSYPDPVVAE